MVLSQSRFRQVYAETLRATNDPQQAWDAACAADVDSAVERLRRHGLSDAEIRAKVRESLRRAEPNAEGRLAMAMAACSPTPIAKAMPATFDESQARIARPRKAVVR